MDLFELAAKINLDSSGFESGIRKAEGMGKAFGKSISNTFQKVTRIAKGLLGSLAIKKAMQAIVSATAKAGDAIDKQSQVLGLSRKAYQEWDYILSQTGGDIEGMNMGMKTLNAAILEGSKDTEAVLKQIGLTSKELKGMSQEDAFERVIRAFQQMPAGAEKSAAAVKLFGRNGMQLLPLLNSDIYTIDILRQKAKDLGLVMSDDAVNASVKYQDTLDTLRRTFNALRNTIGAKVLPALTRGMEKLTGYVNRLRRAFDRGGFKQVIKTVWDDFKRIIPSWDYIKQSVVSAFNKIKDGTSSMNWRDIARVIVEKVRAKFSENISKIKIDFIKFLGIDDEGAGWSAIAKEIMVKVRSAFGTATTAVKTSFIKLLGINEEDVNWSTVAKTLVQKIRTAVGNTTTAVKTSFAKLLGINEEDVDWSTVAKTLVQKIRSAISTVSSTVKVKFAKLLGVDDEDAGWTDVVSAIARKIRGGFERLSSGVRVNFIKMLGISDPDADWSLVKDEIIKKLQGSSTSVKNVLAKILGITKEGVEGDTSWGDIGKAIVEGLVSHISKRGEFLKRLILGDSYTEGESTWTNVGDEVWGWITKAFEGKDIIGALFTNITDKSVGLINFAGHLIGAVLDWISGSGATDIVNALLSILSTVAVKGIEFINALLPVITNIIQAAVQWLVKPENMRIITELITGIMAAISQNAGLIAGALIHIAVSVLTDQSLWASLKDGFELIVASILDMIFGGNTYQNKLDDIRRRNKIDAENKALKEKAETGRDVYEILKSLYGSGDEAGKGAASQFLRYLGVKEDLIPKYMKNLYGITTGRVESTGQKWAKESIDRMILEVEAGLGEYVDKADEALAKLDSAATSAAESISSAFSSIGFGDGNSGSDGSFAKGAWDIPYDMDARVHANEMILNATQARQYREGNAFGGTAQVVAALQGLRQDMQNMQLVVGEKALGRATVQYGGTRMNGYIGRSERRVAAGYGWG